MHCPVPLPTLQPCGKSPCLVEIGNRYPQGLPTVLGIRSIYTISLSLFALGVLRAGCRGARNGHGGDGRNTGQKEADAPTGLRPDLALTPLVTACGVRVPCPA